MKKFFEKCNNLTENSDIYDEGRKTVMFSYDELMKKSVKELKAMLADDNLFPLDETADTEIIERICDVITKKENVPSLLREARAKKSWQKFKKKYIRLDELEEESPLIEIEVKTSKVKKPAPYPYIAVFSAVAAALIVVFTVKIPENPLYTPLSSIPIIEDIKTTTETTAVSDPAIFSSIYWSIPEDRKVEATGTIVYDDKSTKTYTIYSYDGDISFICLLTFASDNPNYPSDSQMNSFDIFEHAGIDDSNVNKSRSVKMIYLGKNKIEKQIEIYGDVTGINIGDTVYSVTYAGD
jgi:uncharacterized protein YlbG (UPF0298 family)